MTQTTTLRDAARKLVIAEVKRAAGLSHEMNYHRLHIRRDGTVSWFEAIGRAENIIDDQTKWFAPVPSVVCVGTGSCVCNCQHCDDVYDEADERNARDAGREYHKDAKYATREEAIADAVCESDLGMIEEDMLKAFYAIPIGYFDDEEQAAAVTATEEEE